MSVQNKKLQQLIKKFSALALAAIASHGTASGQVVLSVPDTTLKMAHISIGVGADSINIDLNHDSVPDFRIKVKFKKKTTLTYTSNTATAFISYLYRYYTFKALGSKNGWLPAANTKYVKPLDSNQKITTDLQFKGLYNLNDLYFLKQTITKTNGNTNTKSQKLGYFYKDTLRYIGVKFYDTTGAAHVGWIELEVTGDTSVTILKYAYEQTGDSIYAGTKPLSLGVADSASTSATIAVQPVFNGKIYYVVLDSTQSLPNAEQVINGTDGDGNAAVVASYVDVTTAPDTTLIDITGLSPSSKYRFCMVMQDASGTNDIDVYSVEFSTTAGTATEVEAENPVVKIYPNPAREYIRLEGVPTGSRVEIYDISGKKVYEVRGFRGGAVDISELRPGVYNVRVIGKGYLLTKKLVKY